MKKRNFTKRASALVAALTVFALMLGGTYAWYATTHAENIFTGEKQTEPEIPPPYLHDDFDPETGQKEVYVENSGDEESVIYVRLKLEEFMDLTVKERPEVITDWQTHMPVKGDDGWFHHEDCENKNAAGECFHDYFSWNWGYDWNGDVKHTKWYKPSADQPAENVFDSYVQDTADYSNVADKTGLKQTAAGMIMSIDYYLNAYTLDQQKAYVGWIYDTDGWVYWSQPLKGGEATSMLLRSVDTDKELLKDTDYIYIIDVIMDAVDADDLPMWLEGAGSREDDKITTDPASDMAKQALNIITTIQ